MAIEGDRLSPKGESVYQALRQRYRAAKENEGGFTLIELLIVIIILGVLAGIVVFSVSFIQDRGEKAACQTDYRNVQTALEAYYAENSSYPDSLDTLVSTGVLKAPLPPDSDGIVYHQLDGGGWYSLDSACPTDTPSGGASG